MIQYFQIKQVYFLIIFPIIFIVCCTGGPKENQVNPNEKKEQADSNLIFDGKTLDGWEITNFGPQGPVYVSGGSIVLGMGDGCTGINRVKEFPLTNYEVSLEAKRVAGNDFFAGITFPVGKDYCSLIVGGWGGPVTGLSSIDKMDASENETTSYRKYEKDRWYKICLVVRQDSIRAFIDDEVVVNFEIGNKKLSIRSEVELSKPFGISSWNTTAAIRNIRLRSIEDIVPE